MSGKQKEGYVEMEKKLKDMGVELNELAIAMCDYIQTGQKTEQLSKFWDNEDSFYKTFEKELENGDNPQSIVISVMPVDFEFYQNNIRIPLPQHQ